MADAAPGLAAASPRPFGDIGRPFAARSLAALFLCAVMMLVEGFDLAAMPLVVPLASGAWGISPARFAWSLSAVIVGIGTGAVLLAPLGDRLGRRRVIVASAVVLALVTAGTAMAASPGAFTVWRLLTGLALGTCLPNTTALAAALAPDRLRARCLTLVMAAVPVGSVAAGLSAGWLESVAGWPSFFAVAAAITLVAALAFAVVLERDRAEPSAAAAEAAETRPSRLPVMEPLRVRHRRATLALLALGTCNTFLIYMLISWLPTLLPRIGVTVATAAKLSTLLQVGGLAGGLAYSWLIDLGLARRTFLCGYALAIAALLMLAATPGVALSAALLLLVGIGISGAHTTITIYGIGFFPAAMVSSFLGLSIAITRAGAILGPLAGGRLVAREDISPFMITAAIVAALCFVCVLTVPQAGGRRDQSA